MKLKSLWVAAVVILATAIPAFSFGAAPVAAGPNGSVGSGDTARYQGAISAGWYHACAVVSDGTVKCWGLNNAGQLGIGLTSGQSPNTVPQTVLNLTDVASVHLAGDSSCALKTDGTVWCWGDGTSGILGIAKADYGLHTDNCIFTDDTSIDNLDLLWCHTPMQLSGLTGVTSLSISYGHSCAVAAGVVKCWGYDGFGQLGRGSTDDSGTLFHVPSPATVLSAISPAGVVEVAAGMDSTCILDTAAKVWCWGSDVWGTLGDGAGRSDSLTPVEVLGGVAAVSRPAGGSVYCAIKATDGELFCWGMNYQGAAGTNTAGSSTVPVATSTGLTDVVAVNGGWAHTCAALSNGEAKCWGDSQSGQVGNGVTGDPFHWTTPQDVTVLSDAINVAAITGGDFFTCAVSTERNLYCWGDGFYGTLGVEREEMDNCYFVADGNFHCYISFEIAQLRGMLGRDEAPELTDLPRATGTPGVSWGAAPRNDSTTDVAATKPFPTPGFGRVVIGKELTLVFSQDAQGRISVKPFVRMKNFIGKVRYSIVIPGEYSCTAKSFGSTKKNSKKNWVTFSPGAAQQCPKISYDKANLVYRGDQPMLITLDHSRLNRATGKAPANNKVRNFEITITSATVNNFPL